jgi:hypothetical protein
MNNRHLYVLLRKPTYRGPVEKETAKSLFCAGKIPLVELIETEPAGIAQFLYVDSYTPAWARRHRRPLRAGDGFWLNGAAYLFTRAESSDKLELFVTGNIKLKEILAG